MQILQYKGSLAFTAAGVVFFDSAVSSSLVITLTGFFSVVLADAFLLLAGALVDVDLVLVLVAGLVSLVSGAGFADAGFTSLAGSCL